MSLAPKLLQSKPYIEKALKDLPTLPAVVTRLLEMTSNDTVTTAELEQMIGADQGIATKLLRVVNSSYFGLPRQVSSIGQAVVILGFQQVRNLVLSVGAMSVFSARTPRAREMQRYCWEHAFGAASCARLIAESKRLDPRDQETVFLGGLLHDVGRLFLLSTMTTMYYQVHEKAKSGEIPLAQLEQDTFGIDHAQLGMQLAVAWNFPEQLALLIGRHEGPFGGEAIPLLYCVHAADRVASAVLYNPEEPPANSTTDPEVLAWMGFNEQRRTWLHEETVVSVEKVAEFIGLL